MLELNCVLQGVVSVSLGSRPFYSARAGDVVEYLAVLTGEQIPGLQAKGGVRRETQRIYTTSPGFETIPPRNSVRVLPTKNQNPDELEPLENMRKLLIQETPLAALQESPSASLTRSRAGFGTEAPLNLPFDLMLPGSGLPAEEGKRQLPLVALVASLVVGGFVAGVSQLSTKPLTSYISQPKEYIPAQPVAEPPTPNQEIANSILNHFKPEEKMLWW
jgi:hypothetical protein